MTFAPESPQLTCTPSIAGLGLSIESDDAALIDRLRAHYQAYLSPNAPRLSLRLNDIRHAPPLTDKPMAFDRGVLHFTAPAYTGYIDMVARRGELTLSTTHPLEDVDYFVRAAYALLAFEAGGLLFHAAGVAHQGRGYAFFGHSGSGKTTVSRLSKGKIILNDDLIMLLPDPANSHWTMHATPFSNPTQFTPSGPQQAALTGLLRLVQDTLVFLEDLPRPPAVAEVIASVPIIPLDPQRNLALIDRVDRLLQVVPAYRLHFLPDDSFWAVVER